jgi:hypothetical protein
MVRDEGCHIVTADRELPRPGNTGYVGTAGRPANLVAMVASNTLRGMTVNTLLGELMEAAVGTSTAFKSAGCWTVGAVNGAATTSGYPPPYK